VRRWFADVVAGAAVVAGASVVAGAAVVAISPDAQAAISKASTARMLITVFRFTLSSLIRSCGEVTA
jgi:hypothetical protein